jgi:hypothetical protein
MNAKWLVVAGLVMGSAAGCGLSIKASSDYDKQINFSSYNTFFMVKGNSSGDPVTDARLASDVEAALVSRGWAEVPDGEGQAAVVIHTATTSSHTDKAFYHGWGGWQWRWGGFNSPTKLVEDYAVGTVVVTIFDADTKQALWRGYAADAISDSAKQTVKVREQAVAKIFDKFPARGQIAPPADLETLAPAAEAAADKSRLEGIEAPEIIFSASPAVLIGIDGDPVYRKIDGTGLERIVNTKPLILRDISGTLYLKILDGWMEAYSLDGVWLVAGVPPKDGAAVLRHAVAAADVDLLDGGNAPGSSHNASLAGAPAIYIATTPATLVVTDGPARFARVAGTSLEYIENTTSKVFKEPTDQELYMLVSGRWFRSWTTAGPWQFIPSDQLPADFAKIPDSGLASGFEIRD